MEQPADPRAMADLGPQAADQGLRLVFGSGFRASAFDLRNGFGRCGRFGLVLASSGQLWPVLAEGQMLKTKKMLRRLQKNTNNYENN